MTGRIIPLHGDDHLEAQSLLPWYVTGRLEAAERTLVEAHLNVCAECQGEVKFERRLQAEIAAMPIDVEQGWAQLRRRLERAPSRGTGRSGPGARLMEAWRALTPPHRGRAWTGWAMAASIAMMLFVGVLALPGARPHPYHALGAPSGAASVGNALVIFRPETREQDLRAALEASDARLVGGPTAADAYVIHVPAGERAAALARLRRSAAVTMAEPIDDGGSP